MAEKNTEKVPERDERGRRRKTENEKAREKEKTSK